MPLTRPDASAWLLRWRELWAAGCVALAGLWLIWLGGYFLVPVGVLALALAGALGLLGWRRMRFDQGVEAPGLVEVNEGQVGYLGPTFGGYVALDDLTELRLITMHGKRLWRLKQSDGQALLIPVQAAGAERLFDAFAALPGMDSQALVMAVAPTGTAQGTAVEAPAQAGIGRLIWRRPARVALT